MTGSESEALYLTGPGTALIVYDLTASLTRPGPQFEPYVVEALPAIGRLLDVGRKAGVKIVYALPSGAWEQTGTPPSIAAQPGDLTLRHPKSGAFAGTDLESFLIEGDRKSLLISGMAVDRGCNTTAREALALGIRPIMVRGACFTHDITSSPFGPVAKEDIERIHLAALYRMGITIATIDEIVFALEQPTAVPPG